MYISGKNVAKEVLRNNQKILKAYIWEDLDDRNLISALKERNIDINYVTKFELDRIDN
jgi:tRNA G18 (ribose-2'-O)-methylase SpoU